MSEGTDCKFGDLFDACRLTIILTCCGANDNVLENIDMIDRAAANKAVGATIAAAISGAGEMKMTRVGETEHLLTYQSQPNIV
jgi:hypothetical protein